MSLRQAFVGSLAIENAENYAVADVTSRSMVEDNVHSKSLSKNFDSDQSFWADIRNNPEENWGQSFHFEFACLSEWVARVPGLYWCPGAKRMREVSPALIEMETEEWTQYLPPGKTQKVAGGVGTLRLPPNDRGYRVVALTTTANTSAGVPALVAPEVWDSQKLGDGRLLLGTARWQPMAIEWATRFPTIRGLPRGYLVLDDPGAIHIVEWKVPVLIAPFSIMAYYDRDVELYDYVYILTDTSNEAHRRRIEEFFAEYKEGNGREGRYLIASDVANPLWDAEYGSPEELRRLAPAAESYLKLVCEHIRQRTFDRGTVDELLQRLTAHVPPEDLRRIADDLGLPAARWDRGGTHADSCIQFLERMVERNKLEELILELAKLFPEWFQSRK